MVEVLVGVEVFVGVEVVLDGVDTLETGVVVGLVGVVVIGLVGVDVLVVAVVVVVVVVNEAGFFTADVVGFGDGDDVVEVVVEVSLVFESVFFKLDDDEDVVNGAGLEVAAVVVAAAGFFATVAVGFETGAVVGLVVVVVVGFGADGLDEAVVGFTVVVGLVVVVVVVVVVVGLVAATGLTVVGFTVVVVVVVGLIVVVVGLEGEDVDDVDDANFPFAAVGFTVLVVVVGLVVEEVFDDFRTISSYLFCKSVF